MILYFRWQSSSLEPVAFWWHRNAGSSLLPVMAGLVPAIHALSWRSGSQDVDPRDKPEDDDPGRIPAPSLDHISFEEGANDLKNSGCAAP
jgi:hypothetical protein